LFLFSVHCLWMERIQVLANHLQQHQHHRSHLIAKKWDNGCFSIVLDRPNALNSLSSGVFARL